VTAVLSASLDLSPARSIRNQVSTRCTTYGAGVSNVGCDAINGYSGIGGASTPLGTGTWG
jgi:hypothetical protein